MTLHLNSSQLAGIAFVFLLASCAEDNIVTHGIPTGATKPCDKRIVSGYTDKMSYYGGDNVQAYIQSDSMCRCNIRVFDQQGNVVLNTDSNLFPQTIPADQPWLYGFSFTNPISLSIPASLPSGVYYLENHIPL